MIVKQRLNLTEADIIRLKLTTLEGNAGVQFKVKEADDDNEAVNLKQIKDLISLVRIENKSRYNLNNIIPSTDNTIEDGYSLFDFIIEPEHKTSIIEFNIQVYHSRKGKHGRFGFHKTNIFNTFSLWEATTNKLIENVYIEVTDNDVKFDTFKIIFNNTDKTVKHFILKVGSNKGGIFINTNSKYENLDYTTKILVKEIGETYDRNR